MMPQQIDPNWKPEERQTEVQPCSICHQSRRCRRVRKPRRQDGRIIYDYMWLCESCVYAVEIA